MMRNGPGTVDRPLIMMWYPSERTANVSPVIAVARATVTLRSHSQPASTRTTSTIGQPKNDVSSAEVCASRAAVVTSPASEFDGKAEYEARST